MRNSSLTGQCLLIMTEFVHQVFVNINAQFSASGLTGSVLSAWSVWHPTSLITLLGTPPLSHVLVKVITVHKSLTVFGEVKCHPFCSPGTTHLWGKHESLKDRQDRLGAVVMIYYIESRQENKKGIQSRTELVNQETMNKPWDRTQTWEQRFSTSGKYTLHNTSHWVSVWSLFI